MQLATDIQTPEVSLKVLLAAAKQLLQPPAPLPSAPTQLLERLSSSSTLLPALWKLGTPGWVETDELGEVGDDQDISTADTAATDRRTRRKADLLYVVGKRSFALIRGIQSWLEMEFWPTEANGGLESKDFLLGTADLRILRLLLSHTIASYLLPQAIKYLHELSRQSNNKPTELFETLSSLLLILRPAGPPNGHGSSSNTTYPPTLVTQTLVNSHLPPILLCTILLAYTPTALPPTYAVLRVQLSQTLLTLSPTQSLSSLGAVLRLTRMGKKQVPPRGWNRVWPSYVEAAVSNLMSGQLRRPGGVKGVMENVFGESASLGDSSAVEDEKLDHVANILCRIPKNVPAEVYLSEILTTLFDMIVPSTASSTSHPIVYINAACYTVYKLWQDDSPVVKTGMRHILHSPWIPTMTPEDQLAAQRAPTSKIILMEDNPIKRSMGLIRLLILHSPPSPSFTDYLISPILPPLFALYYLLSPSEHVAGSKIRPRSPVSQGKRPEGRSGAGPTLKTDVKELMNTWSKVVVKDEAVKGLWSIVKSGTGWSAAGIDEEGSEIFWDIEGEVVRLCYRRREGHDNVRPIMIASSLDTDSDLSVPSELLNQLSIAPDPDALASLVKTIDRPDISSELFLKVLNEWRVRSSAEETDPIESMLYLRLTLSMMDKLGDGLLRSPQDVLGFVEGVLSDEVESLKLLQVGEKTGPAIQEIDDQLDDEDLEEADIGKMGMVETAISLLLASLEANGMLNQDNCPIIYPINAHLTTISKTSPSSNVRRLTREAQLVLLVRQASIRPTGDLQSQSVTSDSIKQYQQALKLIADPILPVRAHGLSLLTSLVQSSSSQGSGYDKALTPGIMDIFMKSLQDNDSYIYLNAVKGLAGMVDALGKDVFRALMREYSSSLRALEGSTSGEAESEERLDKVLRLGEALMMVVRRAGKALGDYAEIIVPILFKIFPDQTLPTVVRVSSLSILSTCAETDHLSLLPWSEELINGNIDLIQIESVASSSFRPIPTPIPNEPEVKVEKSWSNKIGKKIQLVDDDEEDDDLSQERDAEETTTQQPLPRIIDSDPIGTDSKHPALRRSSLVSLGHIIAAILEEQVDSQNQTQDKLTARGETFNLRLPGDPIITSQFTGVGGKYISLNLNPRTVQRARTVLRYVGMTDQDEVVRIQAKEVERLVSGLIAADLERGLTGLGSLRIR